MSFCLSLFTPALSSRPVSLTVWLRPPAVCLRPLALRLRPFALGAVLTTAASAAAQVPGYPPMAPPSSGETVYSTGMPYAGQAYGGQTAFVTAQTPADGSYAVPLSGPVATSGPETSTMTTPTPGGPVFMAPQVMQPGMPMSSGVPMSSGMLMQPAMPGADCPCNGGGAMMSQPMMSQPMMSPGIPMQSYGEPIYDSGMMTGSCDTCAPTCAPTCGLESLFCGDSCSSGSACGGSVCGGSVCGGSICDHCNPCRGIYHGSGGTGRSGWAAGYSFVFLKPQFGSNTGLYTQTANANLTSTFGQSFDYNFQLSPRVFVEYVGQNDRGGRVTYFHFDQSSNPLLGNSGGGGTTAVLPVGDNNFGLNNIVGTGAAGETAFVTSTLKFDTIDFDLTRRLKLQKFLVNAGGGLRYANYEQFYNGAINGATANPSRAMVTRHFDGLGPTVFAEVRRPLGDSRFSLIALARQSALVGESRQSGFTVQQNPAGPGAAQQLNQRNNDFLSISELQLGGEWSTWISPRSVLFVQLAYETQYWIGAGNALDRDDNLGLYGFNTTIGLEW